MDFLVRIACLIATIVIGTYGLPKNSDIMEAYRSQYLPELPGYIPVYIRPDSPPSHFKGQPLTSNPHRGGSKPAVPKPAEEKRQPLCDDKRLEKLGRRAERLMAMLGASSVSLNPSPSYQTGEDRRPQETNVPKKMKLCKGKNLG